jgi:hypothetical protein
MASNRTVLEKADLVVQDLITNGGILPEAVAAKFLEIAVKSSVLLPECTVVPMKSREQRIDMFRFNGRVLYPGYEATALPVNRRSKPDLAKALLTTSLFKAEIRLNKEVLEDNIEGDSFKDHIVASAAKAISRDIEDIVINGDTGSADPTLAVLNGLRVQTGTNLVNALSAYTTKTVFKSAIKAMPVEFMSDRKALRFLTSFDSETDYRDSLADRATAVGDKFLLEGVPSTYAGIVVRGVPLFPENLGAPAYHTEMILGDPKNINVGFWRQIEWETDKDIVAGELIIVCSLRMAVKLAYEPSMVKVQNVRVG